MLGHLSSTLATFFFFFWEYVQKKLQMYESALLGWDHRAHTGHASYDPRRVLRAHNTHFQRIGHMVAFLPFSLPFFLFFCVVMTH